MAKYTYYHTHITSPEPQKLVDFFIQVMGAKLVQEYIREGRGEGREKGWDINLGGLYVRISPSTGADPTFKEEYALARERYQYGVHHISLAVDNMDEAVAALTANGAEYAVPRKGSGPAFIIAPGNVLIELVERK